MLVVKALQVDISDTSLVSLAHSSSYLRSSSYTLAALMFFQCAALDILFFVTTREFNQSGYSFRPSNHIVFTDFNSNPVKRLCPA